MARRWAWLRAGALALVLSLAGCGGGGSGDLGVPFASGGIDGGGAATGGDTGAVGGLSGDAGGGTAVAGGGIGSGGTGISSDGVGSGGTGATADAAGVGSVDGFGSIIVNGVRFDTSTARLFLSDVPMLRLGMTVRVSGIVDASLTSGTATVIVSAADLRGTVGQIDAANGRFRVLGVQVTADRATAWGGGLAAVSDLLNGDIAQIHGLPGPGGQLRATRIERLQAAAAPILSGTVDALDTAAQTFRIGSRQVRFANAAFDPAAPASSLANGQVVRVRATVATQPLDATSVEPWYPVGASDGKRLAVSGLVSSFVDLRSMHVDGVPVDARSATISGGSASDLADGARVEAAGTVTNGVLVASRLTVRHPAAPPPTFSARGSVGAFRSPSSFKVQGQDIDAGRPGVVFVNGTAVDLGPGRKVLVTGSHVTDDVLVAERVEFLN